jgi:hypothetical protein
VKDQRIMGFVNRLLENHFHLFFLVACCLLLTSTGCSGVRSDLAAVSGIVTLDGEPLPRATVMFQPEAAGPASFGLTDTSGRYTMMYDVGVKGAVVGMHVVKITTYQERDPDTDPPTPAAPEILPNRYHGATELTAEVIASKKNEINFELFSK